MAREIDCTVLSKVRKEFNPITKEVMVANIYVKYSIWSECIPTTLNLAMTMFLFFVNRNFVCSEDGCALVVAELAHGEEGA